MRTIRSNTGGRRAEGPAAQRRLVFGDDGSATSDAVWEWIAGHPWPGWTIAVVTADDAPDVTILPPDRVVLTPWDPPNPRRLASDQPETRVEHLIGRADPRVVLDSAGPAALMAVGPRGRGLLKQLGVGSTADWLLERPDPPVAVIRSPRPTRRVLVYADGTPDARRALDCLAGLPWIATCDVEVLAARGTGRFVDSSEEAVDVLRRVGAAPVVRRVHAPDWLKPADEASAVLRAIDDIAPDLVALGLPAFEGVRRAFHQTAATESAQSVLVATAR